MGIRPTLTDQIWATAKQWAKSSTCPKRQVGAVLVKDGHIIETGYNGAPPGEAHCTDLGCYEVASKCERAVHAEHNLLLHAARHGHSTLGTTVYVTLKPCFKCQMYMRSAGVKSWKWLEDNRERPGAPQIEVTSEEELRWTLSRSS